MSREMPTVISRDCFWKPKFQSLARQLPFDLKHKISHKSPLSPDQQGHSFLCFVTASESWLPIKTPLSPSERHILRERVNVHVCACGHVGNAMTWIQSRWEPCGQLCTSQGSLRDPWPLAEGQPALRCPVWGGLELAFHTVKR